MPNSQLIKKRKVKLLNRYFKDGRPSLDGNEIRVFKQRWPMVSLIIFAAAITLYAGPITMSLNNILYKYIEPYLNQIFNFQLPIETQIKFIRYFGITFFIYQFAKLLETKFTGVVRAFLMLASGGLLLWYSLKVSYYVTSLLKEIVNSTQTFFFLREIQETQIIYTTLFLGAILIAIGCIMMFYVLLHPIPSDAKVKEWLKQGIDRLWHRSLDKLQIHEEDLSTEEDQRFKIFYPDDTLLHQDESPAKNRTRLANFFLFFSNSIRTWLWPSAEMQYDDELEIGREDWMAKLGRDRVWRYTEYGVIFMFPTEKFMGYYECQYDFLRDTVLEEMFGHHYYDDIVAVHLSEAVNSKKRLGAMKVAKAQKLDIWLRGSENITNEITTNILVRRKLFDRFGPTLNRHDPLETNIDIVVKNLNALLDDKKQHT